VNLIEPGDLCPACGLCVAHCTGPHDLVFHPRAQLGDGRPHPDAGKRVRVDHPLAVRPNA